MELTASDEVIPTEGMVQSQPWPTHPKSDAHGTTDKRPGSGHPKSVRTTDNIAVVQDLICSQDDAPHTPVLCGAPYRSTF